MRLLQAILLVSFLCSVRILNGQDIGKLEAVYRIHDMDKIESEQRLYKKSGEDNLMADIYYPINIESRAKLPIVVFILGYSDDFAIKNMGVKLKGMGQYTSWGKLIAASGMIAVTYETKNPYTDTKDLLAFLNENADSLKTDKENICLWSCSGNVPTALSFLMNDRNENVKCSVLYYGLMPTPDGQYNAVLDSISQALPFSINGISNIKHYHKDLPFFIVRSGLDNIPRLNDMLDYFVKQAILNNMPITFVNYSNGHHAFDVRDNNETSRYIIKQTIEFIKLHLNVQ